MENIKDFVTFIYNKMRTSDDYLKLYKDYNEDQFKKRLTEMNEEKEFARGRFEGQEDMKEVVDLWYDAEKTAIEELMAEKGFDGEE
jgi:hypothetical protein